MIFMRVDFPEPEGPMMAVKAPIFTVRETPRRAGTRILPSWYVLNKSLISKIVSLIPDRPPLFA
jgi:hypothetical protein